MRILVVENDTKLIVSLARALTMVGLYADPVTSLGDAEASVGTVPYAAIILDRDLPDGDGLRLLDVMRRRKQCVPVLIFSARGTVEDRVHGLRRGASDYLVKPFAVEELVTRLQSLLRRHHEAEKTKLRLANVSFDSADKETIISGKGLSITPRETALLEILLRRSGRTVPYHVINEHVFGTVRRMSRSALQVCIHRLRDRLAKAGAGVEIETHRGAGYRIDEKKIER